jgi:hypothetical protein
MHLSRLGPDRNGFRDRMFGRESYPPPPPPFFRDRMMGRFGVRVSFWNMKHFCHEHYSGIHEKRILCVEDAYFYDQIVLDHVKRHSLNIMGTVLCKTRGTKCCFDNVSSVCIFLKSSKVSLLCEVLVPSEVLHLANSLIARFPCHRI